MAVHAASFRIAREGDYNERWSSVVSALQKSRPIACGRGRTPLILLQSNKSAEAIAQSVYLGSSMTDRDILLSGRTSPTRHTPSKARTSTQARYQRS